jgi:hypothetical protein
MKNVIPLALALSDGRVARVLAFATAEGRVMVPIKAAKRQQVARTYEEQQREAEQRDQREHPEFYRLMARKFPLGA